MDLMTILSALNNSHGPAGDEAGVRDTLRSLVEPLADEVRVDALGNLIVHRKGNGPKVMLCAHMDSIGFIVTHIEKDGFLRIGKLGGISPQHEAPAVGEAKAPPRAGLLAEQDHPHAHGRLKIELPLDPCEKRPCVLFCLDGPNHFRALTMRL